MLTKDKITEIFCVADDFCKLYDKEIKKHQMPVSDGKKRRNRSRAMSDAEMITILLCFHFGSFRNFKHFYIFYVQEHLRGEFPNQFSYNRFIQLEHRLLIPLTMFLKLICFGECTGITFMDSTKIAICNNKRIRRNKTFKGYAATGKSSMGWFHGFKLHLVCNDKGEVLDFCLTKGNVDDRNMNVMKVLTKELFGKLYADKGYISSSLFSFLFDEGVHLVTGIRSNMKNCLMSMRDKILLRKRSVIETINDELKNICQIEHSRHRGVANFLINLLSGLGTYCFFEKKPAIKFERGLPTGQLALFH